MKKAINIYTPQEKMPEPDTLLLIESCKEGPVMAYYLGNNTWENEDASETQYRIDDVNWWLNLEKLNISMELSLRKIARKNNQDVA